MPVLRTVTCAPTIERVINFAAEGFGMDKKDRNISEAYQYRSFYEKAAEEDQSKTFSRLDVWYNTDRSR